MNTKPLTNRQKQAIETKKKIFDTAIGLFKEKGYTETTTRDISINANVSQGLIFNYFKNKEAFISELFKTLEPFHQDIYNSLSSADSIRNIIEFVLGLIKSYRDEFGYEFTSVILSHQISYSTDLDVLEDKKRVYYSCLRELLKTAKNDNLLAENVETMLETITKSAIRGSLIQWCLYNGDYDLVLETERTLQFLLKAFKKRED